MDALSIPTTLFGFVKTRVLSDMRTGHTIETLLTGPATNPEYFHRSIRNPRDVRVVLDHHSDEAAKSWEEQHVFQVKPTKYRESAARLNLLAMD